MFGGTVYRAARVDPSARCRANVDDVSAVSLHHSGNDGARHVNQPFYVGFQHSLKVFRSCFVRLVQSERLSSIVDENVYTSPPIFQGADGIVDGIPVRNIKADRQRFC